MVTVQAVDEQSPYLQDVKRLWRVHSATLGFLPDGAFQDYARERHVVVALDERGTCAGYLLYRIVRDRATIAHFCVAPEFRGQGCARAMIDWLIKATKKHRGIMLSCRTDYHANQSWPRLGFYPIGSKLGRAGKIDIWWQGHGHSDLFSATVQPGAIKAVLDVNVFIDLVEKRNEEAMGLEADWLTPFVTLCYTPELLVEINRNQDTETQKRRKAEAEQFAMLECSAEAFHNAEKELLPLFRAQSTEQDESDFRHVVRARAAGADVFVTRDEGLLDKADDVFGACGVAVVRPGELATQIDTLQQEHLYQRRQVAGTNQVFQSRIKAVDERLVSAIKANDEKQHALRELLNTFLADPRRFYCHLLTNRTHEMLAAYVVDRHERLDRIPLMRVCDKRRGSTLARAMLTSVIRDAATVGSNAVLVTDGQADAAACADLGFCCVQGGQLKLVLTGWLSVEKVSSLLTWRDPSVERIKTALPEALTDARVASELEHMLWPAKLSDSALQSYIVPIQPRYAEHLVDGRLATGSLFGADADLALNPESAYYRAARPNIGNCPSRVLWYVSQDSHYPGTMSIRACSRIVEVVKGTPKALHKRFRRLGVYEWADVLKTAGSVNDEIMAFRFDDTELLRPMDWHEFQAILKANEINTTLQSPSAIPAHVFGMLYVAALNPPPVR